MEAFKEYVIVLSGIGTFLSSLIAIYTLREIKKQRRASYQPEVLIDTFTGYLHWDGSFESKSFFKYRRSTFNTWQDSPKEEKHIYLLYKLQNIGLGVAKNVTCEWKFDFDLAMSEIQTQLPEHYNLDRSSDGGSLRYKKDYITFFYDNDLDKDKLDFILPESQSPNQKDTSIPNSVMNLYTYYLIFKNKLYQKDVSEFNFEGFESLPKLYLTMKYKDIGAKSYKRKFEISFEFAETRMLPSRADNEIGLFYVNIKSI